MSSTKLSFARFPLLLTLSAAPTTLCLLGLGCGHKQAPPPEQPTAGPAATAAPAPSATVAAPMVPAAAVAPAAPLDEPTQAASGFQKFFMVDECTGQYPPQPDTCAHARRHEVSFVFGGKTGTVYDVALHVRGIWEPTVIKGGETPYPEQPSFKVGGTVETGDWSHWHIEVSNPKQTYFLNHHSWVSHTIYGDDYQATIPVAAGATVAIRVIDGNDRQIDNAKWGPDRKRLIEGQTDKPLEGQMLRLDVVSVKAR